MACLVGVEMLIQSSVRDKSWCPELPRVKCTSLWGSRARKTATSALKVNDRLERSQGLNAQEDWCLPALQGVDSKFTWLPIGLYADLGRAEAAVLGGVPKGEGRRLLRGEALQTTGTIAAAGFSAALLRGLGRCQSSGWRLHRSRPCLRPLPHWLSRYSRSPERVRYGRLSCTA